MKPFPDDVAEEDRQASLDALSAYRGLTPAERKAGRAALAWLVDELATVDAELAP